MSILDNIQKRAKILNKKHKIKVAFPESNDNRIKKAVSILKRRKICEPILIKKNFLGNPTTKAIKLLNEKKVNAIISGANHKTKDVLLLAFKFKNPDVKRISGAILMVNNNKKPLLFADCSVQINPDSKQLAEIAILSAKTYRLLTEKKPVIAMLSYSTHASGNGLSPLEVRHATLLARRKATKEKFEIDGDIQVDAALIPWIAKKKKSKIKGNANVFIFPNLDSGNIAYKLVERLGDYKATGCILQGMEKQINDLSRGCSVEDIVNLTAITVLQVCKKN